MRKLILILLIQFLFITAINHWTDYRIGVIYMGEYSPKVEVKRDCWVRALRKLEEIEKDPTIFEPKMWLGHNTVANGDHAWISYKKHINRNRVREIWYDTDNEQVIKYMWKKERDFSRCKN